MIAGSRASLYKEHNFTYKSNLAHSRDFAHDFEALPSRINDIALDAELHSYVQ